jgi:hypothetical protein
MIALCAALLLGGGFYALLLGFGKLDRPKRWRGREETQWIGRFSLLFGTLFLLDACGITPHQISEWLQDILTSGGGAGTG